MLSRAPGEVHAQSQPSAAASQLGADEFVLQIFPGRQGFFVDVGAADGHVLSNTAKLEALGWRGIAIDPLLKNWDQRTRTQAIQAAVYSQAGLEVDFVVCGQDPNLSGIAGELNTYRSTVMSSGAQVTRLKTVLLSDVLDGAGAPTNIEYLSLDTEGSEWAILSTFPFHKYTFGVISVEHNFEEPKRGMMRQLLEQNGYMHAAAVQWDDWYLHHSVAAPYLASRVAASMEQAAGLGQ